MKTKLICPPKYRALLFIFYLTGLSSVFSQHGDSLVYDLPLESYNLYLEHPAQVENAFPGQPVMKYEPYGKLTRGFDYPQVPIKLNADSSQPNTKKRTFAMTGIHVGLYAGSLVILNEAWYKDYPRGKFRTFKDWPEWQQMDKVGHAWSGYQLSRASYAGWRWAGIAEKKAVLTAGISGFTFLTVIEILDGFSEEWGWSWGDFGANVLGSGLFVAQHLAWKEERISYKFSFHKMKYGNPQLDERSDDLFGASLPERMLKDYNGQTYWLSANLKSFMKNSKLPPWLNISVGYGASGMLGGTENKWMDETTGQIYNRTDIPRLRQWYLAPDIDFTRIKTNSKWMRTLFYALNAFKMPAPTLVLSNGKFRVHGFYF